ncbi:MAG: hypothetical protein KAS32_00850 [Candidatus Peribacteraceae bacterium]|nr:hypothetical protein [Candidatus Peribacteraceae bacterium]
MATNRIGILGVSTSGSAPPLQALRKFDRSDRIIMRAFSDAPMMHIMIQRGMKRGVKSVKYYMTEDDYFIQSGTLEGATAAGADTALTTAVQYLTVLGPASESANTFIRVGDILHVGAMQTNQTATKGTGDGTTDGTVQLAGEDMIVREIVSANLVRVARNGGAGTATGGVTAGSGNTLNWDHKGNIFGDASASPAALSDALEEDYNYREVQRRPWDISGRNLMEDSYGMADMQRLAIKNRTQFLRDMEKKFWSNHRYLAYTAQSLDESHTGGWFEFVSDTSTTWTRIAAYDASKDLVIGDSTQRVWMVNSNFGLSNWNTFMEKSLKYGSKNKLGVGGREYLTNLEDLLRPYYGSFDWDEDTFGFGVVLARTSFGQIPIVVEQEWSDGAATYKYNFACVDMDYVWYTYGMGPCAIKGCGNTNSDLHIHKEIQANDEAHRKDELFADFGFDQRFRKAHSWLIWDGTN